MAVRKMTSQETNRRLRDRKGSKYYYSEEWLLGEDEVEGCNYTLNLQEKLQSERFAINLVREMQGSDLNVEFFQRHEFTVPLLFKEKTGLGILVPSNNFSVNDVRLCVGSRRLLDVMDVNTQKNCEMTMKEWQRYYEDPKKDKLLNVISLEFSHTKLENFIQTPDIVRKVDWVERVWPKQLIEAQTVSTNAIDDMMYPKVRKYCLMSVKGCYTDFHIDFGGTSVWYHVLRGSKIFWLIPPTEDNIQLYEKWVLSGKQEDVFFGETVECCGRVMLEEGNTFFIPTGWIHAVYTPKDSLVFGGNFLHSFSISKQLRIAKVEDTTKVPQKFRYPFFTEMLWFVLERYVYCVLGKSHIKNSPSKNDMPQKYTHLTNDEVQGLRDILVYLQTLPANKKNVPNLIENPVELIRNVRVLAEEHESDNADNAVTGVSVIFSEDSNQSKHVKTNGTPVKRKYNKTKSLMKTNGTQFKPATSYRRRRTRCKKCQACLENDCGECVYCKDMIKFGGSGRAKQTCKMRQCLQPLLPSTAICAVCGLDGWGLSLDNTKQKLKKEEPSSLMECSICYEIVHPQCISIDVSDVKGILDEDLPSSWECPKCCKDGRNVENKRRHFLARHKVSGNRQELGVDNSKVKEELLDLESMPMFIMSNNLELESVPFSANKESQPKRLKAEDTAVQSTDLKFSVVKKDIENL
uniref:[histone H3]-dimethyl-L-lysine(36) demethylase n=1 Tax=Clastoptera arizonana TaxID=38151 RepID=A0A1B6EBZ4_9HEMI